MNRTLMHIDPDFRLLAAEIATEEQIPWPQALQRAAQVWDTLEHDDDSVVPPPTCDWRFIAWLLLLLVLVSVAVNITFVWLLASAS